MARVVWVLLLAMIAGPAFAQEAPARGPAPDWVDVLDVPATKDEPGAPGQAGIQFHLIDQQLHFNDGVSHTSSVPSIR